MPRAVALGVATLVCMTACIPTLPLSGPATTNTSGSTQTASAATNSTLRIGKAVRSDLNGVLLYTATLQSKGEVAIVPRVVAPIARVAVDLGARVRAGNTLVELDHTDLDQRVLEAQAAQASAEAKLAQLKAGPKAEVLAAAQANYNAAQARVKALQSAQGSADVATLDQRVKDARAALDAAQAAMQPDSQAVAQADAAVQTAQGKLNDIMADPTKSKDQNTVNAAKSDLQKAQDAATKARLPTGTQAAVNTAQRDLEDTQQAQLLARFSTTAFDLDQARALADAADAQLKLAQAPASDEEIKAAETAVEEAFAQAELARARAKDATITAPIDGIVTDIKTQVGSTVGPSAAVMTLIPPDLQVIVRADQAQLPQLQSGQPVNVSIQGFDKDAFNGTVTAIAPVLDPRTRSAAIQIDVPDPQRKLKPGMFAQLSIQTGQRPGALVVPKDSVMQIGAVDPGAPVQSVVYLVNQGRLHRQIVTTGVTDGKNIEILQGVDEGADLVLNPRPDFLEGELISAL